MPAFTLQAFVPFDNSLLENWQKMMGLNTDFTTSMMQEAQFDWASCFMPQEPEELYAAVDQPDADAVDSAALRHGNARTGRRHAACGWTPGAICSACRRCCRPCP
jgi:hypothetical protein